MIPSSSGLGSSTLPPPAFPGFFVLARFYACVSPACIYIYISIHPLVVLSNVWWIRHKNNTGQTHFVGSNLRAQGRRKGARGEDKEKQAQQHVLS